MTCSHEEHRDSWQVDHKHYHRANPNHPKQQQVKIVAEYFCTCGAVAEREIEEDWHDC